MRAKMNFVYFCPDEMRAESLACYGHPLVQTPNYDALARQGTRFDKCYGQHPVCSPSRCSFMTGWYPHVSGHRTLWHLLRPHEPNMLRYLKEAGYRIVWFGKNDLLSQDSFPLSVDVVTSARGKTHGRNPYSLDDVRYYSFLYEPVEGDMEGIADLANVREAIRFLKSGPQQPFVLYLPLSYPHPAYSAPQPYHDMYSPTDVPPLRPPGLPHKPDFHRLIRQYRRLNELPDEFFARIQAVYLGMVSFVDFMLGELLQALSETGLDSSTAVFAFSDHGDWAGDYGLVEKWPSALDDSIVRVPLIVRLPGGAQGHVVQEPVELLDIMATTMELAGVEVKHTHFSTSLVPQLHGEKGDPGRAAYAEGGYDVHEPHCFEGRQERFDIPPDVTGIYYPKGLQQQEKPESVCRSTMMRTLDYKLIRRTLGVNELYDMKEDPRELSNVYYDEAYGRVRAELEDRMLDWYLRTADVVPPDRDPRGLS